MNGDEVLATAAIAGYSVLLNRVIPARLHIPANLATATAAVLLVHHDGASWQDLGVAPARLRSGVRTGALAAVPIVAATTAFAFMPMTRRRFRDPRVAKAPHPIFELALRIPVGTALCEELLFRSALLSFFERRTTRVRAIAATAALFGLWHVLPARDAIDANTANNDQAQTGIASTVVATAAAGVVFAILRRRSRSVAAPVIVHAALNASAFAAARLVPACPRQ